MDRKQLHEKAMALPLSPGVYLMKDKGGHIIYIGKAKALKNRVSQYFGSGSGHTVKVARMVDSVDTFDYILTDSEFEALVLECSLIKQYQPKYNILLKDDKGYHYIKITAGDWPRIQEAKQKEDDGAVYLGPYLSGFSVKQAVDEALKIFKLPRCSKQFPRDYRKSRPCLNGFMDLCAAPCAGRITREEYQESVRAAVAFLKGGAQQSVQDMQQEMEQAAERLEFERAAKLRDRIKAIQRLGGKQKVHSIHVPEEDVFALVNGAKKACVSVLRFENGTLYDSEYFIIDSVEDEGTAFRELLEQFYTIRRKIPTRISIDAAVAESALLEEFLSQKRGKKVRIVRPQKGEQAHILQMCKSNAAQHLAQLEGRSGKEMAALEELSKLLGLPKPPEWIESYDISHTAGSHNVAGMVVFHNGRASKKDYKRFSIKGFQGQDDYASMEEVLRRRFSRYLEERDSGEGLGRLPDLILLDGGEGQVNAVLPVLKELGIQVPVFGMVKDSRHRTRAIASGGGEIAIQSSRKAFTLVSTIQEEVHRFAVSYHRTRQKNAALSSTLLEIDGVGPARAKALLKHFKTITAIRSASVEQLQDADGISAVLARQIHESLHRQ
ncbi:MAG: excinuclease ABC subunit UvrC [Clostridiales bacterium]|nr:excinuclease ABC subunit UvrC [Clostridiales bacterium]